MRTPGRYRQVQRLSLVHSKLRRPHLQVTLHRPIRDGQTDTYTQTDRQMSRDTEADSKESIVDISQSSDAHCRYKVSSLLGRGAATAFTTVAANHSTRKQGGRL